MVVIRDPNHPRDRIALGNQALEEETNQLDDLPVPYDPLMGEIKTTEDS